MKLKEIILGQNSCCGLPGEEGGQHGPLKHFYPISSLQGVITQKTMTWILITMKIISVFAIELLEFASFHKYDAYLGYLFKILKNLYEQNGSN